MANHNPTINKVNLSRSTLSTLALGLSCLFSNTYAQATSTYTTWAEGACQFTQSPYVNHGANRDFYNAGAGLRWVNYAGDWRDAKGNAQGDVPYSSTYVEDTDSVQQIVLDSTQLVDEWVSGKLPNQGLMLRAPSSPSSKTDFVSKEASDANSHPLLIVDTSLGQYQLVPVADTVIRTNTYQCGGVIESMRVYGSISRVLMQFDLSAIPTGTSVLNASLVLTTTENQYGHSNLELFAVNIETQSVPDASLSGQYPNDFEMKYDDSVLLVESFESANWHNKWNYSGNAQVTTSSEANNFEPLIGSALVATVKQGEFYGLNLNYKLSDFGPELEELYLRYYVRFGDNWLPNDTGKLPGIGGTYGNTPYEGGWGGRRSDGTNGWSARGHFGLQIQGNNPYEGQYPIGNYVYHADQPGSYGESIILQSEPLEKNQWYAIEQHIKMNTPGENDGVIETWVDGALVYQDKTFRFRNEGFENIKIERVWMNIYHGGKKTANQDITAYIDNVVIAKTYIGPVNFQLGKPASGSEANRPPEITYFSPSKQDIDLPLGESITFLAEGIDPENSYIEVDWYINGQLVAENQNEYNLLRSFDNLDTLTIESKLRDADGGVAINTWLVGSLSENFSSVEATQDTYLPTWTYQSRGQLSTLKFTQTSNVLLAFDPIDDMNSEDIKSAHIVLHSAEQYGDINLRVYKTVGDWIQGDHTHDGATRNYRDYVTRTPWTNLIGDWVDASGVLSGDNYYSDTFVEDTDTLKKVYLDVTELLKETLQNAENLNAFIKTSESSSKNYMHSLEAEPAYRPRLLIEKH